ncbi:MAG: permease [Firmicutes bacterium HGW-Firmicutes-12]|nr:MAG: permease [Firmicutes bacterium HGW-Firmicutes-12]
MKAIVKTQKFLIIVIIINIAVLIHYPQIGKQSLIFTSKNLINFLFMLTPIFVCIGLLDIWIEKEVMIKIMGDKSGIRGVLISFMLGTLTAVPLYALLPVAGILLKKESKISNVLIFICSSSSIRIPLLLFEVSSMGWKFTVTRFIVNVFVVIAIAFTIEKILTKEDKKKILYNVNAL